MEALLNSASHLANYMWQNAAWTQLLDSQRRAVMRRASVVPHLRPNQQVYANARRKASITVASK